MKAMLASDVDLDKLRFPLFIQPKIDGVRALHQGSLTGRSLEPFANLHTSQFFSHPSLFGLDGEMAAEDERHPRLCSLTTSALTTIQGTPWLLWHVFDYVAPNASHLAYCDRLDRVRDIVYGLKLYNPTLANHVRVIPSTEVRNLDELLAQHEKNILQGYEGSCIRDPYGKHKAGRSTVREMGLLRMKEFQDDEALVIGITEGQTNNNPATIDARGHTKRSSHQENMVPNGEVGSLQCRMIRDVYNNATGKLLFPKGHEFTLANGRMTVAEAKDFFGNPHKIVGQIVKFQHMPHGVKTMPRIATFQSIRMPQDM